MLKSRRATPWLALQYIKETWKDTVHTLRNVFIDEFKREEDTFYGKVKMTIHFANLYKGLEPLNWLQKHLKHMYLLALIKSLVWKQQIFWRTKSLKGSFSVTSLGRHEDWTGPLDENARTTPWTSSVQEVKCTSLCGCGGSCSSFQLCRTVFHLRSCFHFFPPPNRRLLFKLKPTFDNRQRACPGQQIYF